MFGVIERFLWGVFEGFVGCCYGCVDVIRCGSVDGVDFFFGFMVGISNRNEWFFMKNGCMWGWWK